MNFNEKSSAILGIEKTRQSLFIHSRLNNAISEEKKRLEEEGFEIPSTSLSVQGDTRQKWNPEKYFIKFYQSFINDTKSKYGLTISELGIILTLSTYIDYENNLLRKSNGDPLRKKDLSEILEIGHNAVDKYMTSLVKKGVLAKLKVKRSVHYYMNPYIFFKGTRIDNTLLDMFKTIN